MTKKVCNNTNFVKWATLGMPATFDSPTLFKSVHEAVISLFATDGTGRENLSTEMSAQRFYVLLLRLFCDNFEKI